MTKNEEAKQDLPISKTYPELINAIGADITPRIIDFSKITSLTEAVAEAIHAGPTLELIAQFVGWRHEELKTQERKEQAKC